MPPVHTPVRAKKVGKHNELAEKIDGKDGLLEKTITSGAIDRLKAKAGVGMMSSKVTPMLRNLARNFIHKVMFNSIVRAAAAKKNTIEAEMVLRSINEALSQPLPVEVRVNVQRDKPRVKGKRHKARVPRAIDYPKVN